MPELFDPFFAAIENLSLSTWLRESPSLWGFPFVLILHTAGLAFLVGSSVAVNVRVLGFARGVPLGPLSRYFTVMWCGFWLNAFSGVLLLLAYPTKALTNPLFYLKLGFIAVAQLARLLLGWEILVNGMAVPLWPSAVATLLFGAVSVLAWRERSR